jgi:uncharacterized protein (DUF302 family)
MIPGGRIVCSLIVLTSIAAMEVAMPDPVITQQTIQVEHVRIEAAKPFADVKAALEDLVPPLDPGILGLLQRGETERARSELERLPALSIFDSRDHGALLRIAGQSRKAVQYEIGNPLTATRMTQHQLPAALYAPLRVDLYENEAGHAVFEYDRPSSLFGQFGDERVTAVARELDASLERVLAQAAHSGEEQ